MAFVGDIKMDEVMADDGLLPFTDSDSQTYSSEEEEEEEEGDGLVSQEEVGGFVSDTEDMDLVPDKGSIGSVSSEGKDEGEDEEQYGTIRPKIPFKQRCDPLVRPNHEKFQKIENYFFSLLRAPGISVDDILQGTFDDHEITLITPQSSPPDLVEWQRRNARRYYENLETRLKGGTDTLAFKMTCLYFGFPVEPLRMGTMPFLPSPDPDPVDAKNAALNADPLAFLNKYNDQEKCKLFSCSHCSNCFSPYFLLRRLTIALQSSTTRTVSVYAVAASAPGQPFIQAKNTIMRTLHSLVGCLLKLRQEW